MMVPQTLRDVVATGGEQQMASEIAPEKVKVL
jgi:hypothetical protein